MIMSVTPDADGYVTIYMVTSFGRRGIERAMREQPHTWLVRQASQYLPIGEASHPQADVPRLRLSAFGPNLRSGSYVNISVPHRIKLSALGPVGGRNDPFLDDASRELVRQATDTKDRSTVGVSDSDSDCADSDSRRSVQPAISEVEDRETKLHPHSEEEELRFTQEYAITQFSDEPVDTAGGHEMTLKDEIKAEKKRARNKKNRERKRRNEAARKRTASEALLGRLLAQQALIGAVIIAIGIGLAVMAVRGYAVYM
ncbi:hypothetical protein C8035_v001040 [Colletotrichum spinosum]|uniref:Uncharacterized protein n=1 Tax=Colletotrichum spinosum TaxID=1347390 RepID=A0A4R8Q147_9PEZI|nr:hypothetical protein C8035_v001040 [Colletotrichum spinosum]